MEIDKDTLQALAAALHAIREPLEIEGIIHEGHSEAIREACRRLEELAKPAVVESYTPLED